MATTDDDTAAQANVTLGARELKPPIMEWVVEDVLREFQIHKT